MVTNNDNRAQLQQLCDQFLSQRRLVLASNRGPLEHRITPEGRIEARRGSGGVVTALSSLTQMLEFTWIASAMGEGDRKVHDDSQGAAIKSPLPNQRIKVRFVVTPRRVYHKYYNVFCNPLLWFLQHYMWNSPYNPNIDETVLDAWHDGYVPVNQEFADAVVAECAGSTKPPLVMLHDYHLYLTPLFVRRKLPEAIIQHFVHIPWPTPRYWQLLPAFMRRAICEGLCSANIVGFQTPHDVRNFLDTCEEFLPEAKVDHNDRAVYFEERQILCRAYPISIDVEEVQRIANSPRALEYERKLRPLMGDHTIIRVDRAEPSKNIVRGFKAYEILLSRYPELHGKIKFLAFLVPSRAHIRQYQRYMTEIDEAVKQVNDTFGRPDWEPVTVFYENNYTQAIAGMKLYDVLLVNSVIDGMNLVAKEGPVVNTRAGVLVLSETSGSYKQLGEWALGVGPADLEGTAQALYQAITMDPAERDRRAAKLAEAISREDITHWLYRQMADIQAIG